MRPLARQSARLASHSRASSCSRIRQSSVPRYAQAQHVRAFNSSAQRALALDPRPPNSSSFGFDELSKRQREEQEHEAKKPEEDGEHGKAKGSTATGEGKKLNRRERKMAMQHAHGMPEVPKPPPIPDWFLKHNVFLARDVASLDSAGQINDVMRCVDAETGHTLFTVPYHEPTTPRMTSVVRGKELDMSALGLEKDTITGLPDHLREEMIIHNLQVQRSKRPEEIDQEGLAELLVALPRDMQEEILRREAVEGKRKPRDKTADYIREADAGSTKDRRKMKKISASTSPLGQNFFDQKYSAQPSSPIQAKSTRDWMAQNGFRSSSKDSLDIFAPFYEAETAVRAGLAMADSPQHSSSFAASRVDLALHCPDSDSHDAMDTLVTDLAASVSADVVRLDANDLEDLTNEYVGGGQDTPGSFSTLGYDVYDGYHASKAPEQRGIFGSRPPGEDEDEFDVDEEEDEDYDEDVDDRSFDRGFSSIEDLRKAVSDRRHELGRALSKMGVQVHVGSPQIVHAGSGGTPQGMPQGVVAMMGRGPKSLPFHSPDEVNYDEARLTALLESVLDAVKEKKSQGDARDQASASSKEPSSGAGQNQADAGRFVTNYVTSSGALKVEKEQISPNTSSTDFEVRRKTIVHIRDLNDLKRSNLGNTIIQRLVRIAEKRRRSGEGLIVVGTSAQGGLDNMFVRSPSEDGMPFRTITTPPVFRPTADQRQKLKVALDRPHTHVDSSADIKIENINLRHTQSMLRRLRPEQRDGATDMRSDSAKRQMPLAERERLMEKVWSLDQVQRLVLTAIGLAESYAKSNVVQPMHIALAVHLTVKADQVANAWERDVKRSDDLFKSLRPGGSKEKDGANSAEDGSSRSKIEEIKSSCNQHESKLLTGVVDANNIKTGFADVHATPETIEALKTLTTLSLLRPEAFTYGVLAADRLPGLLLYGPPGTGKTLLAKAVAKESKATVLEISGAQIYEKYVGEGEKMVRAVFSLAKKLSPCVVFIDEADAIFGSRNSAGNRNTHREIINQFLREWDGMDDHRVFMMVASNRPFDMDDAVLRRLPRRLLIDLPVAKDRESILGIHLKGEQVDSSVDLAKLAEQTPFYSGSDLKNLCVAAALACVREENGLVAENKDNADFKLPEKRTLHQRHFDVAVKEISASISEDMSSLTAIRKFDEQYGDRKGRRRKNGYGFGMGEGEVDEMSVRVRPGEASAPPP